MIDVFGDEILFEGQTVARITAKAGTTRDMFEDHLINAMSPDDEVRATAGDLDDAETRGFALGKNRVLEGVLHLAVNKIARKLAGLPDNVNTVKALQALSKHLVKIYGEG